MKIKPKFWGDTLWFYPALMLVIGGGFGVFVWRLCHGESYWLGLCVLENLLIQPIFLLMWIDSLLNTAVFEENQLILKGFLHKKKIEYRNIVGISFSGLEQPTLIHFNPKLGKKEFTRLFVWNHSINILIDEIKKRANITVNGYPSEINKHNFSGKIWFLIIMAVTIGLLVASFWKMPGLKPEYKNISVPGQTQ